jgi:hypothetical protein
MLPIAITDSTWQVIGTGIAAIAALASWAAVIIAVRAAGDAREAERNANRPSLLLAPAYATAGPLAPTMTLSVHNAGAGIAQNVGVLLVTGRAFAYHGLSFIAPGETVYFGSEVPAETNHRAVVYGRSADGEGLAWNIQGARRSLASAPADLPSYAESFAAFYPGDSVEEGRELKPLLRG